LRHGELTGPARGSGRDNRADRSAVSDAIATQPTHEKDSSKAWDATTEVSGRPGPTPVSGRKAGDPPLNGADERIQHLLAVSPAIIYTNRVSAEFPCTFVSENLHAIMG
jgi:hypothetical protein